MLRQDTSLEACRRNNKKEKRERNRAYSRKWAKPGQSQSRKASIVEMKRNIVKTSEEDFIAKVFLFTTDDDMPEYSGFDFN